MIMCMRISRRPKLLVASTVVWQSVLHDGVDDGATAVTGVDVCVDASRQWCARLVLMAVYDADVQDACGRLR